jgi:prophage antirepressor-like protein
MTLRTITKDGEPWFVAADVCNSLALFVDNGRVGKWIAGLDDDEKHTEIKGGSEFPTLFASNSGRVSLVSEAGLYSLVILSRSPEAKQFKKWVTSVVLPAIRKTGGYVMGEEKVKTGEMLFAPIEY